MKFTSIKTQLIIFLFGFAIYLSIKDKDSISLLTTLIAVISAVGVELAILYFKDKKLSITDSSIISGLIIGYVLSQDNPPWIFILASLFAILSKHLIRINKKHIFNPAAFGIFLTIILFNAVTHKVYVSLNGKKIIEHKISRQDNNTTQSVSYLIPDAKAGDSISVEAYCSISGQLKKEIKI